MSDNKGANRLYLLTITAFVAASLAIGRLSRIEMPVYATLVIAQMSILIPAILYCKKRKIVIRELIPCRKISFSTGILVVVSTYLMYPLMIVLNAVTLLFTDSALAGVQTEMMNGSMVVATLVIAVLPACAEEFLFRGVLFQTYRKSRILPAIIISAFLFGCMHMNLNQFGYAFVMGIYLAFLVEGTGSIFSSILAHFTLNFTGVFLNWILKNFYSSQAMDSAMQQTGNFLQNEKEQVVMLLMGIFIWFVIAMGTTVAGVAVYIQICKLNGRWEHMKKMFRKGTRERIITIPLILAVAAAVMIMILSL